MPSLPYDTNALIKQTQDMLAQTAAQGTTAFKGSSYDTITPAALAPVQPFKPVTPTVVNPVVAPTAPVVTPTVTPPVTQPTSSREDIINQEYAPLPGDAEISDTRRLIASLGDVNTQEVARRSQLEADPIYLAKKQQVQDLTAQFDQLANEYKTIPLQVQQDITTGGANVTKGGVAPIQTAQLRQNAIKQLGVSSLLSAANGNLSLAIQQVDAAVKAEFDPKRAQLADARANLEMYMSDPARTTEEKRRAAITTARLDAADAQVKADEENKTAIYDMGIKAVQLGADSLTLSAINSAKTKEEALQILAQSGLIAPAKAKRETQVVKLDNGSTVLIDTQTGEIISRAGGAKAVVSDAPAGSTNIVLGGQEVSVNENALAYAQRYASTGTLPNPSELKLSGLSVSQVTELARNLPKPDGALIDNNTGVKPSSLSAAQEAGITAMNEIVTKTMPALKDRFSKINTGLVGGTLGSLFTSQDRQDYNTFRAEFLSKLLVARSGAAVTEQEYERYSKLLPSNFNQLFFLGSDGGKKLNSLSNSMQTNLDSTLNTNQLSVIGYSDVKKQLEQLSPTQKAELDKEGLLPAWYK